MVQELRRANAHGHVLLWKEITRRVGKIKVHFESPILPDEMNATWSLSSLMGMGVIQALRSIGFTAPSRPASIHASAEFLRTCRAPCDGGSQHELLVPQESITAVNSPVARFLPHSNETYV